MSTLLDGKSLYFGSLFPNERQYQSNEFIGLSLEPKHDREVKHNAYDKIPASDSSISKIQSQDVFEHLEYKFIPEILDDIYRVLTKGGIFRLSVPDYHSPLLKKRSLYDEGGRVIADLMMSTRVVLAEDRLSRKVIFANDGNSHLWFPTYDQVLRAVIASDIRKCSHIHTHHAFFDRDSYVCNPFPDLGMTVTRCPPRDMRAGGMPISIIMDFVK